MKLKVLEALVLVLVLQLVGLAETKSQKVWGSGSTVYGQATMGGSAMPTHTLTISLRFVNKTTGVATPWTTRQTLNGATNVTLISMVRPSSPTDFVLDAIYKVWCPKGQYNSEESRSTLFTIGYDINCLYLIPGTGELVIKPDGTKLWYYGLYEMAPYCNVPCKVKTPIGFTTPLEIGHPTANVQVRFWWVNVWLLGKWCLDAYDYNRNTCTGANCAEYVK